MNLPMIDQNLLAKDGYNDLNLILDLVIVNRERAKYIGLALDVLDTIQVNVENQGNVISSSANRLERHQRTGLEQGWIVNPRFLISYFRIETLDF